MIICEATEADVKELSKFLHDTLTAWGYSLESLDAYHKKMLQRMPQTRYAFLSEGGEVACALAVRPVEWQGKGTVFEILIWTAPPTHPDKLRVLDALALWGFNLIRSEGVQYIFSRQPRPTSVLYGRDHLGQEVWEGDGVPEKDDRIFQWGKVESMMARILERRPEWRLSP